MLEKKIIFCNTDVTLRCDGRCDKAFGINGRPRTVLSADEDDYVYRSDTEVGTAPGPGETVVAEEGLDAKPSATPLLDASRMNRWCVRECERASINGLPPDLSLPQPNLARRPMPEASTQRERQSSVRLSNGATLALVGEDVFWFRLNGDPAGAVTMVQRDLPSVACMFLELLCRLHERDGDVIRVTDMECFAKTLFEMARCVIERPRLEAPDA